MADELTMEKFTNKIDIENDARLKAKIAKIFDTSNLGKKTIYGIRDKYNGFYNVFIGTNDGAVCRDVISGMKAAEKYQQPNPIQDFPDNYAIYKIAEIDEDSTVVNNILSKVIEVKDLIEMTK